MKKDRGFIRLPRNFDQLDIFTSSKRAQDLKIYLACYSRARTVDGIWTDELTGEDVLLRKGQFVFGRLSFAKYVNLPASTVRNSIDRLIKDRLIKKDLVLEKHYTIMSVALIQKEDKAFYFTTNEILGTLNKKVDNVQDMQVDTKNNERIMDINNNIYTEPKNEISIVDVTKYQVVQKDIEEAKQVNQLWNELFGTQFRSLNFARNLGYWRQTYSLDEIIKAINNLFNAPKSFWLKSRGTPSPTTLFRTKTTKGDNADYLEQCLNLKQKPKSIPTKSRYEELKAKTKYGALTNAEMEEFADLTIKYEGSEQ